MSHRSGWVLATLLLLGPVEAQDKPPASARPAANLVVTLTVGKVGGGPGTASERVYRILGSDGGQAKMLMGWRTPIPTTNDSGATSYVYQNLGVSADFEVAILAERKVRLRGQMEVSGTRQGQVVDPAGGKPPLIGTFQQFVSVVLQEGKKLRAAEVPDPEGGTLYVDLDVDIVD